MTIGKEVANQHLREVKIYTHIKKNNYTAINKSS